MIHPTGQKGMSFNSSNVKIALAELRLATIFSGGQKLEIQTTEIKNMTKWLGVKILLPLPRLVDWARNPGQHNCVFIDSQTSR